MVDFRVNFMGIDTKQIRIGKGVWMMHSETRAFFFLSDGGCVDVTHPHSGRQCLVAIIECNDHDNGNYFGYFFNHNFCSGLFHLFLY